MVASASGDGSSATAGAGGNFDIASAVGHRQHGRRRNRRRAGTPHSPPAPAATPMPALATATTPSALGTDSSAIAGVGNNDLAAAVNGGDATAGGFQSIAFADGANSDAQATRDRGHRLRHQHRQWVRPSHFRGYCCCSVQRQRPRPIIGTDSTATAGSWRQLGPRRRLRRPAPRDAPPAPTSCSTYRRRCRGAKA